MAESWDNEHDDAKAFERPAGAPFSEELYLQMDAEIKRLRKSPAPSATGAREFERVVQILHRYPLSNEDWTKVSELKRAMPAAAPAPAEPQTEAAAEYAAKNPLGGPAVMFEAMASRIRAGEDYDAVLADYDLQHTPRVEARRESDSMEWRWLPDGSGNWVPKDGREAVTEEMWDGLARDIVFWMDMLGPSENPTPRSLLQFLKNVGREVPTWLRDDPAMQSLDHSIPKGTRAVFIYRAMRELPPDMKSGSAT